jgi:hypothetical protein
MFTESHSISHSLSLSLCVCAPSQQEDVELEENPAKTRFGFLFEGMLGEKMGLFLSVSHAHGGEEIIRKKKNEEAARRTCLKKM